MNSGRTRGADRVEAADILAMTAPAGLSFNSRHRIIDTADATRVAANADL
ncbi:hypothetical protein [Nocardia rhamnosiphila]